MVTAGSPFPELPRPWACPTSGPSRAQLDSMYDLHRKAAEQHELAAKAHRTAAEHNEKGDDDAARWHSERALEYADHAYKLAKEAHNRSGQIVSL